MNEIIIFYLTCLIFTGVYSFLKILYFVLCKIEKHQKNK